jgi:hypothetical protein
MTNMNFIGLDIHKKTINYCVKDAADAVTSAGNPTQEIRGRAEKRWKCRSPTLPIALGNHQVR